MSNRHIAVCSTSLFPPTRQAGRAVQEREEGLMFPLDNTIALVSGASRGVGKGIALGLAESRATVYILGGAKADRECCVQHGQSRHRPDEHVYG